MKISDLKNRVIAIYAGRFQPFHQGHARAFQELQKHFGADNTYIATSGKQEPNKSPFSFEEKRAMIQAALPGLDPGRVFQEITPYAPRTLPSQLGLDPNRDVLIFGVGSKDMAEDPRFTFAPLKDGTPSYFQPLKGNEHNLRSFTDEKVNGQRRGHGYVYPVQDYKFDVAGQTIGSASEIRSRFAQADEETRRRIIADLYPQAPKSVQDQVYRIFVKHLGQQA